MKHGLTGIYLGITSNFDQNLFLMDKSLR
jgi:hypothetical protein